MEKNNYSLIIVALQVLIVILLVIGMAQMRSKSPNQQMGMHRMPDGSMMSNSTESDMHGMMMNMTARMEGKTGDELDRIFLEDMIVHHEGAVAMALELQKGTKRPELQKMAKEIIDVQTKEIEMMKAWLNEWF